MRNSYLGAVTQYASGITYSAAGDPTSITFNNGVTETRTFNNRFQQTQIAAGSLLTMDYKYCDAGTATCLSGNTGSPWRQTITAGGQSAVQEYRHDTLNRLTWAAERPGTQGFSPACPDAGSVWCQQYQYDRTGNRTAVNQYPPAPVGQAGTYNSGNNRITNANFGYDSVGNLNQTPFATGVSGIATMAYDAENRQVAFCPNDATPASCVNQTGNGRTLYVYDGLGSRVQGKDASGHVTTFVYDAFGNLAAEYGATLQAAGTQYLSVDAMGTTRLVMGTQTERHDFQPYGYEVETTGWRSGVAGYGPADTVRQKFTGQERDGESSLDYFNARYYSAAQGRFASVDPDNAGANPADPQTWNGYAYVAGSPLLYTDPDGLGFWSDVGNFLLNMGMNMLTGGTLQIGGGPTLGGGISGPGGGVYGGGSTGGFIFSFADQAGSVTDQVGRWEGLIPIWGSGKHAYYDAKRSCVQGTFVNTALAVSDAFLVKGTVEAVGKGAWKLGSNTWDATRAWYGAKRELEFGQHVHHWAIPRNGWAKSVPNAVKNQPWNLMPLEPPPGYSYNQWHNAIEGKGVAAQGALERLWNGTPGWFKNAAANIGGRIGQVSDWIECR